MTKRKSEMKKRVLSGMRPTGPLHIGHLVGALKNWVRLQDEYECSFMIADWHALMSEYEDPKLTRKYALDMMIDWLSCGIDARRSTLFVQSHIEEHTQLHLVLSNITPFISDERYVYQKCWFSNLGRTIRSDDNRIVNVNATLMYTKKLKVTGISGELTKLREQAGPLFV